jgi:hypothetical protein
MRVLTTLALVMCIPALLMATESVAFIALLGILGSFAAWSLSRQRWRNNGSVELTKEGATVTSPGMELEIARDHIEDGYETSDEGVVVRLRNGATFEGNTHDSKQILAHLGLTLDQRALTAPLRGTFGSFTRGLLTFFGTVIASTPIIALGREWIWLSYVIATLATILVVTKLKPKVVVGADGIRIVGVLSPKFIPYASIRSVKREGVQGTWAMTVITNDGSQLLPVIGISKDQTDALVRRIEEGRARFADRTARSIDALDRNARPLAEWREGIKAAMTGSFREAALGTNDLEDVLADPKAPLERRIGAALALREDASGRERIRVAAETTADPRVRVALENAASDELDEPALMRSIEEE